MNRIYSQLATRMLGLGTAGLLLVAVGCGKAKPEKSVSGKDQPGVSATAGKTAKPGRPAVADASLTAVERAARDKMAKLAAKQGPAGRRFAKADAKERQALDKTFQLLRDDKADPAARTQALNDLLGVCDPEVVKVAHLALACGDPEQREVAMELLADFTSPEILPVVGKGLDDAAPEVRTAAIQALDEQHGTTALEMVGKVLNDQDAEVREAALNRLFEEDPASYTPLLSPAVTSDYPDLREKTLQLLFENRSHAGLEVLIEGLRSTDPQVREEISEAISQLVSEEFDSYEQARAFWDQNKNKFDDDLIEK
jgi:HEAT repeat protein